VLHALPWSYQQLIVSVLGCCIGSFLNVVIYRLPNGFSIVRPASHCPRCRHSIAAYDNIPLLSYLLLRGRCRSCGAAISPRYPLVELASGLLALLLFRRYGWHPQFWVEFLFVCVLLAIFCIDLDTMLIPDILSLPGIAIGLAASFVTPRLSPLESVLGIVLGGGLFYFIAVAYRRLRGQEGLGGGDVKLLAMIGAFIGWPGVVFTILTASVSGTLVGVIVMLRKREGLTTMLPFGPFLALGAVCYLFWGQAFFNWCWGPEILIIP
jgi:leader peptidase (prepilin peptidase) / N-methyltransferase